MVSPQVIGKIFEYIVKLKIRRKGYLTFRCAGSRPFDILAIKEGPIYIKFCDTKKEMLGYVTDLRESGYVVIKQSGHNEYVAIKDNVILLLMLTLYIDIRVLAEIVKYNIEYIIIKDFYREFLESLSLNKCRDIMVIECKIEDIITEDQFKELIRLCSIMETSLYIITIRNRKLYVKMYSSMGRPMIEYSLPIKELMVIGKYV